MKKLMILALLAVFAVGCTAASVEETEYDNGIQLIDKEEVQLPTEREGS